MDETVDSESISLERFDHITLIDDIWTIVLRYVAYHFMIQEASFAECEICDMLIGLSLVSKCWRDIVYSPFMLSMR